MATESNTRTVVYMPPSLRKKIRLEAARTDQSMSQLICAATTQYLDAQTKAALGQVP